MIIDVIGEIYTSMSRNKLRIALTGFSIAWGIFMLIVLLGAGNGLLHGIQDIFSSQSVNTVTLWPGQTSKVGDGMPKDREIKLDINDIEYLRSQFPQEISNIQPLIESSAVLSINGNHVSTNLQGVYPDYISSSDIRVITGRTINEMDIRERRKVCMLHQSTVEKLYGDSLSGVGEFIQAGDLKFLVIGIYKRLMRDRDERTIIPITTAGAIFKPDQNFTELKLIVDNLDTKEANEDFNKELRAVLAKRKQFDPDDRRAVGLWNAYEDYLQTQTIMSGLILFIWIIGLATLIAGVTGISNIMLITVKERTHEFGIRKAIGARPAEIVRLVILESIAITLVFGYIGMFFGIGLTQLANMILSHMNSDNMAFKNPTVDIKIIMMATAVMVIAGIIAGYIPAKRAVSIKPVEALAAS